MLLLTGPTAAGKNTVAAEIASRLERCAIIDYDQFHTMFVKPHAPPWEGEEGKQQQHLGIHMVCDVAERFLSEGANWPIVILDVVLNKSEMVYKQRLAKHNLQIVQLLPGYEEILSRFNERGPVLTLEQLEFVYAEQAALETYDLQIDNTELSVAEVATKVISFWQS